MADIEASDITYSVSILDMQRVGRRGNIVTGTVSYGDGALTYPTGGLPLTKAKLGCPVVLKSLSILEDNAAGYIYQYDVSTEKLRIFTVPALDGNVAAAQALDEMTGAVPASILEVRAEGW